MPSLTEQLLAIAKQHMGCTIDLDVAHEKGCPTIESQDSEQCNCDPVILVKSIKRGLHPDPSPEIETRLVRKKGDELSWDKKKHEWN